MAELPSPAELPASLTIRRGKIVFRARRPVALVLPLFAVTEIAGRDLPARSARRSAGSSWPPRWSGWLTTAVVLRPALELTRDGLVQRQYPYSSLTRWDVIEDVGIAKAGNRVILAYKLVPDIPPPAAPACAGSASGGQRTVRRRMVRRFAGRGAREALEVVTAT